ncbi:ArsC/Spx/MgsR family protein [Bacillus toyonensis]|uniref:ArsC/Spx/MgsR family protein n=1 Tax=Bacillus toyonensis TaxID=155322 RepID=UPI002E1DA2D5|nr:ArsC/Spx/MgsR family protein [Bacillus toyonensis]
METLVIYTKSSCASSRNAVKFLDEHNIPYKRVRLGMKGSTISKSHLDYLIKNSNAGFEGLVNRNKLEGLLDLSVEECKEYLRENPRFLKTPILIGRQNYYVGYNDSVYGMFFTRELRRQKLKRLMTLAV